MADEDDLWGDIEVEEVVVSTAVARPEPEPVKPDIPWWAERASRGDMGGESSWLAAQELSPTCDLILWDGALGHCTWCNEELPDEMTYWCSRTCYGRFMYNHYWPNARKRSIRSHGDRCARPRCRSTQELQVNHILPFAGASRPQFTCYHHQTNLEPLCLPHHVEETVRQLHERKGWECPSRDEVIARAAAALEPLTTCGATTSSGDPCSRWVDPDTLCWQHGVNRVRTSGRLGEHL